MPISGRVTGKAAILATLAAMSDVVRSATGEAVRVTASEVVRGAISRVPVETGTLRDHIAFSFSPLYASAKVGIAPGTVVVRGDQRAEYKKATREDAKVFRAQGWKTYRASHYAHLVEFGGRGGKLPARPFLGPAFDGQQGTLDARMRAAQRETLTTLANVGSSYL